MLPSHMRKPRSKQIKKLDPGPPRSDMKPLPVPYTELPFMAKIYYCPP